MTSDNWYNIIMIIYYDLTNFLLIGAYPIFNIFLTTNTVHAMMKFQFSTIVRVVQTTFTSLHSFYLCEPYFRLLVTDTDTGM